jgi:L-threonylcarbamoyladenylate synthase
MPCSGWFQLRVAAHHLRLGEVIAHATEGVWGLACDAFNETAVGKLLHIKERPRSKGLIVIAHSIEQFGALLGGLGEAQRQILADAWPGPTTFLVSAPHAPRWLRGEHQQLAVRVPAHAQARALCKCFGGPLVSTSANLHGRSPAHDARQVRRDFGARLGCVLAGATGGLTGPTEIRDLVSGRVIRPAAGGS